MSRLVDYFVVVGFDHEKERGGLSSGIILQRFPETNWDDTPFHEGIEWFCQPQGWALSTERLEPRFYVSVLTDVDANKHYCACLCFNETVAITPSKPADEDEESLESRSVTNITHHSIMYAPKCLVIVSRQDYIDTFRNCLGIIYTVWVENLGVPLETLVGNLVACVMVPPPGGPQVRFSLGAGDRQALQPPASPPLPVTHTSVHMLLRLLGIHNVVTLWCAVMSEHKVLLVSLASARLASACRALAALMFPFRYAHVFIPILPAGLSEVLATPTPFLIGVHSSLKEEVSELLDVIVADLDVGSLHIPAAVNIPSPEYSLLSSLQDALALVLQPELKSADLAFTPSIQNVSPPHMLDKEIRAVFMRTLAKLLQGYRHCLTIIRIHPSPVLSFHKAGFTGLRGLSQCQFTLRLLDSMFFNGFVAERGPPWRRTDLWDDLVQNLPEQLRLESKNPEIELQHIQDLAMQIHLNENPNPQTYQQRILRPPEGVSTRIHQPPFPTLHKEIITRLINELIAKNDNAHKISALRNPLPRIVPVGAAPTGASSEQLMLTNSARRLEVLDSCISAIFECRYADARKSFPAAVRALRAPAARRHLLRRLTNHMHHNIHILQQQQFDLLVRLMNCALQSASSIDEHSVAAAMLPVATAYCRKLCTGVIQYAYMCIQEHSVWTSQQFWEAAFYQDVQRDIKALYLQTPNHNRASSPRDDIDYMSLLKSQEPSALEIAAEQMRLWNNMDKEKQRELVASEESTLYSQAIHYANRMVYLLLPLEGAGKRADVKADDLDRASNSISNSVAESDSADAESGFEEADPGEVGNNVIKMVSRFVDKVCCEGGVSANAVRLLHQMVPGLLHMQAEALDQVAHESRRLPPTQKPRIVSPTLVSGESLAVPALRAFLVADGRETSLLPAEGALFLTNYRIIFRGTPTDPFACEQTVIRSFPVCSLSREKQVRTHYIQHLEQSLQEGLQLRSSTFQLIKVALDAEVSNEQVENLRKQLQRLRHPPHALLHFAFAGKAQGPQSNTMLPKHSTLKGFAKKTLLKTARKAGLKPKPSKSQKYVLPSADARSLTSPPLMSSLSADTLSLEELESVTSENEPRMSDLRTLERLQERSYARDWARLGLSTGQFRLSHCNALYTICRSYPAILPVPECVSDESIRRISRCYRQNRFPVITWKHPRTGALIARSSTSHHKGVMGMLKASSHQTQTTTQGTEPTSSLEQERFLSILVSCTPSSRGELDDSTLSLDSLMLCEDAHGNTTPIFTKAHAGFGIVGRNSGGKGNITLSTKNNFSRWGSLNRRAPSHLDVYPPTKQRLSTADGDSACGDPRSQSLYVCSEKGCSVGVNGAWLLEVEVPEPRVLRHAIKKVHRATMPSNNTADSPLYKLIEESGWMVLLRQLFQLSGAVVDLVDLQGSSVLLSLEDGWDTTAQVSSLAQICLDPFYRTIEGFRILIEKEWLALGHKFQQRLNIAPAPQQGFTPVFLMFLDAVHQLLKQFPLAFEFNDLFLRFIAYHSVSCRFRTFVCDSEAMRAELGLAAADDKRADTARLGVETCGSCDEEGGSPRGPALGLSLFDHLDKLHQKTPMFYNFLYTPDLDNPVLRPMSAISCLEIWEYYVSEDLSSGAIYDLEALPEHDNKNSLRRVITNGYDVVWRSSPDAFSGLLERCRQLELELGHLPQKWRVRWEQLELPNTVHMQRRTSMPLSLVRLRCLASHKRSSLEVIKGGVSSSPSSSHRFVAALAPAHCDHCAHVLWGPTKSGVRCVDCNVVLHASCADSFSSACTKSKPTPIERERDSQVVNSTTTTGTIQSTSQPYYEQFSSNVAENRTHEGHLYKRGALLKGWKQRWFVLDSIKHQLRYYDAMEDSHCKGFIDLAEVITVTQAPPAPGPPKKCDDRSFFDLRTSRRTYNFCASDANAAQEWIEKLQACLQ